MMIIANLSTFNFNINVYSKLILNFVIRFRLIIESPPNPCFHSLLHTHTPCHNHNHNLMPTNHIQIILHFMWAFIQSSPQNVRIKCVRFVRTNPASWQRMDCRTHQKCVCRSVGRLAGNVISTCTGNIVHVWF